MKKLLVAFALLMSARAHADTRNVGAFHGLSVSCVLEVDVTLGNATKVELTGPAEWTARVTTKVDKGVLKVDMPGSFHDVPTLHLSITTPSLDAIELSGVVDLHASNLAGKSLTFSDSGVGKVELAGQLETLSVDMSGAAKLHAKDLVANQVTIGLSGAGNASIYAAKALTASLSGVGHIDVYGHPAAVTKDVSGMGKIRLK